MPIVLKHCKKCGKPEKMALSCELCLSCRIEKMRREKQCRKSYYQRNRERILEKAKNHYKEFRKECEKPKTTTNKKLWTVHYIKTEGGYMWRAWFRNPSSGRLVKFESAQEFNTIQGARYDYEQATR